jgi:hypothetical protein
MLDHPILRKNDVEALGSGVLCRIGAMPAAQDADGVVLAYERTFFPILKSTR